MGTKRKLNSSYFSGIDQDGDAPPVKKVKIENNDEMDFVLENTIEEQNNEYYDLIDSLQVELTKAEQIEILRENRQYVPRGLPEVNTNSHKRMCYNHGPKTNIQNSPLQLLFHVADVITFGALLPCNKCIYGRFIFGKWTYLCTGWNQWSKCNNSTDQPIRIAVVIPEAIREAHPFLDKEFVVQNRALREVPPTFARESNA